VRIRSKREERGIKREREFKRESSRETHKLEMLE